MNSNHETEYVLVNSSGSVVSSTSPTSKYLALVPSNAHEVADRGELTSWHSEEASITVEVRSLKNGLGQAQQTFGYIVIVRVRPTRLRMKPVEPLTARQRDVYELLLDGATNKHIAHELNLSMGTVHSHVRDVLHKFRVRSRVELITLGERGRFSST